MISNQGLGNWSEILKTELAKNLAGNVNGKLQGPNSNKACRTIGRKREEK